MSKAWDAWQRLDLSGVAESGGDLADSEHWQTVALTLCGRSDALSCITALSGLSSCETTQEVGGRSIAEWIALGEAYVDSCMSQLGASPHYDSGAVAEFPRYHSGEAKELVASLRQGRLDYSEFAEALLKTRDPLRWFEGAPLLLRLTMAAGDKSTAKKLLDIAKADFSEAPWMSFLEAKAQLTAQINLVSHEPPEALHFAHRFDEEGRAVVDRLGKELGEEAVSSLAGLQEVLDPDTECSAILRLDREMLSTYLSAGALVIVHEERPEHPGFAQICAFDADQCIVLIDSMDRPGYECRSWSEQESRMSLYGQAALIYCAAGKPENLDLKHDQDLALLGATESDQLDPEAGRARQEELARRAVEACRDIPRAYQVHGLALLAQLIAGELEHSNTDGPLERWYAQARTQFQHAEWAHQIYAQALEHWNEQEEAAIAWNDAYNLDALDARNLIGLARTRSREGLLSAAVPFACEALRADPGRLDAWRLRAELAEAQGDNKLAILAASIVLQVEEGDPSAHHITATCAEKKGDLEEALKHFDQAALGGGPRPMARASVLAGRLGDFEGAQGRAMALVDKDPENYHNHLRASAGFARNGEHDDAMGILEYALSRFGPHEPLVQGYAERISDALSKDDCAERVAAFCENWSEYEQPLVDLGLELASAGYLGLAFKCFDCAQAANRDALNPRWHKAQCYLRTGNRAKAAKALETMLEQTTMPHAFALWTEVRGKSKNEDCRKLLGKADTSHAPVLVWESARYLAEERGDSSVAESLKERLLGLPVKALCSALSFLLQVGATNLSGHLAPLLEEHPEADSQRLAILQQQAAFSYRSGDEARAAKILDKLHQDFPDAIVTWEEMSMVLDSGSAEVLRGIADKALQRLLQGSPESFGDGYVERGYLAAADALDGNFKTLERLLAKHANHLALYKCALRAAYGRSDIHSKRWGKSLSALAPGLRTRIQTELVERSK